jgi:REP element-mobilizing transposase RayT
MERFDAQVLAYSLMGDHYQFVLYTRRANLSLIMRQINSVYTQRYNLRHGTQGQLFQGRFKATLVDRDAYLLELCRYVELNPVRAHLADDVASWPWSSYRSHAGLAPTTAWLDTQGLHAYVLGETPTTERHHKEAARRYANLVGKDLKAHPESDLWARGLRRQIYLGDDAFVERMQAQAKTLRLSSTRAPRQQRLKPREIAGWIAKAGSRDQGIFDAFTQGGHTMTAVAKALGLSVSRVSRVIRVLESAQSAGGGDRS